jgi:hypothetical protein
MNETSSTDDLRNEPVDDLDRLLSEFFKGQMKNPWPAAPVVGASEPTSLAAARTGEAETPRNRPGSPTRDHGRRARYTLAASVALLLGGGWFLSNAFQPGERPTPNPGPSPSELSGGTAGESAILEKIREEKAKKDDGFLLPKTGGPKIELP